MQVLRVIGAVATILVGLFVLVRPKAAEGFTGLTAPGPRGISELRAVMGGFFIALGAVPLIIGTRDTYKMLGIAYLTVAVVRAVSIVIDNSTDRSNWISLVSEVVLGLMLVF